MASAQPAPSADDKKKAFEMAKQARSSHFCACLLCVDHRLAHFRVAAAGDGVQGGAVWEVRGHCDAATPGLQSESCCPLVLGTLRH